MGKVILKESQLIKLIEVAMDISRYRDPIYVPTGGENKDIEETTGEIISRLKELLSFFQSNRNITTQEKLELYKSFDDLNSLYNKIKYKKNFT